MPSVARNNLLQLTRGCRMEMRMHRPPCYMRAWRKSVEYDQKEAISNLLCGNIEIHILSLPPKRNNRMKKMEEKFERFSLLVCPVLQADRPGWHTVVAIIQDAATAPVAPSTKCKCSNLEKYYSTLSLTNTPNENAAVG